MIDAESQFFGHLLKALSRRPMFPARWSWRSWRLQPLASSNRSYPSSILRDSPIGTGASVGTSTDSHSKAPAVQISGIPLGTTQWSKVLLLSTRVRPGPLFRERDHWCVKGHILLCIEGQLHTELEDGRVFTLGPGMSFQVADNAEPHRSYTSVGAKLFIVD